MLPLLPLYIGYLSGGTGVRGEDKRIRYDQKKVAVHTFCFVVGVSFAFFLLGLGVSAIGTFFQSSQMLFARIGGILVMLFGLYQLGIFGDSQILGKEHRLSFRADALAMSPFTALLMGFTFSFAWTPCVGPALTGVLLMAASAATKATGFLLIGVYTLGFVLPFLAVGFFTTSLLELFKRYRNVVQYTVKAGGVLLVLMGLMMFTGKMNDVTGYLSGISQLPSSGQEQEKMPGTESAGGKGAEETGNSDRKEMPEAGNTDGAEEAPGAGGKVAEEAESTLPPAVDFQLQDQYGNTHTLGGLQGKTIFLNFWATWCPPCRAEMPDIQKIYDSYKENGDDSLVVLGVASPGQGQEGSLEEVAGFLEENGYTYPVLMDTTGEQFAAYGVYALPTTFMIDRDGNVFGYVSGQLTEEIMLDIIRQTMEGRRS